MRARARTYTHREAAAVVMAIAMAMAVAVAATAAGARPGETLKCAAKRAAAHARFLLDARGAALPVS